MTGRVRLWAGIGALVVLAAAAAIAWTVHENRSAPPLGAHPADVHRVTRNPGSAGNLPNAPTARVGSVGLMLGGVDGSPQRADVGVQCPASPGRHWHSLRVGQSAVDGPCRIRLTVVRAYALPRSENDAADVKADPVR